MTVRSRSHPAGMKLVIGFIYVLGGSLVLMGLLSGAEGPAVVIPVLAFGISFLALARGLQTWNRWAWYVAVILYGLSIVGAFAALTEGDPTGLGGVIPLAIVWYLWKHRAEFSIGTETAAAGRPAAEPAPRPRGTAPVDGAPYQPPPEYQPTSSTPQDTACLVFTCPDCRTKMRLPAGVEVRARCPNPNCRAQRRVRPDGSSYVEAETPGVDREGAAIDVFLDLATRGGAGPRQEADLALLRKKIPNDGLTWHGGVRQNSPGGELYVVAGVTSTQLNAGEQTRLGELEAASYPGFFSAAARGIAYCDVSRVAEWFGDSVEANYPEASGVFLAFARTYWTLKVHVRELEVWQSDAVVAHALRRLDNLISHLFFPYEGPLLIDPARREHDQRRFLDKFAPGIDLDEFMAGNPILIRDRRRYRG